VRAYGMFSLRIVDELLFLTNLVGSRGLQTTYALEGFFRSMIISRLVDVLGNTLDSILNLARFYREIAENVRAATREEMSNYGIELVDLVVEAITPPPEVQEMINKAGGIAAQDLIAYSQISMADALVAAASNSSGTAGEGVGTGVGIAMGLGAARELLGSNAITGGASTAEGRVTPAGDGSGPMSPGQALEKLRIIKIMLDEGLITHEQYEKERQEVLDIL
jgi:membrane protease subunit (stomatin/prohibitin family)